MGFNGTFEKTFFCRLSALCLTETTQKVTLLSTNWRQLSTINPPKSLKPKYIATFPR